MKKAIFAGYKGNKTAFTAIFTYSVAIMAILAIEPYGFGT
jgi:hypothetical protein